MRCTAIAKSTGKQCGQVAIVGKSVCYAHRDHDEKVLEVPSELSTEVMQRTPVELRATLSRLRPDLQAAVLAARLIRDAEAIREDAAIAQALADEFLSNASPLPSAEVVSSAIQHYKGAADLRLTAHKIEYAQDNLISKMEVIAILREVAQSLDKGMRAKCARVSTLDHDVRERLEKSLRDLIGDCMEKALTKALVAKGKS